jgi:hypothetical protein
VIMFAITTVIFTLTVVPAVANGGVNLLREQLKNRPPDPNVQEALRMLESAPAAGLATVLLISLFMLFVFITLLSMAGGALGAKFVGRNHS